MGADFAFSQLSRFLDPGVRLTMQRVTLGEPDPPPLQPLPGPREGAIIEPIVDLRALLRGKF
jgi:DNA helicase-2/ATP-dependent DNA helicase PcrA